MHFLKWAFICLILAVFAAVFGFGNVAAGAALAAQILFVIFIGLTLMFFGVSLWRSRRKE